jgi:hypothetical protein
MFIGSRCPDCTDIVELKYKSAMLTLQLDYSVLDKSHKITFDLKAALTWRKP